ncbi:MAG: lipase family protein [Micromonosporaceae bacterium]
MAVGQWCVRLLCVRPLCVIVGAVLIFSPVKSLAALLVLVAAGLILTAALELAHAAPGTPTAPRVARLTASVITGLLVLIWPGVTVFVISVLVGVLVVWSAIAEPAWLRVPPTRAAMVGLGVTVALVSVSELMHAADVRPDGFYTPPAVAPATPGVLVRSEPFHRTVPAGAHAWRILYTTTRDDRTAAVASALVLAADRPPPGPRPVLAWAHGATGIARECAPSLLDDSLTAVPGLDRVLAQGWVVVATDYVGLGTPGPHPFLIGQGGARSVLDSVRAARQLSAVTLGGQTLVWGYSQGGNAALWTGILAPTYAPDAGVIGVATLAPGSNLTVLADNWGRGQGGVINAAYLIQAYSETYPDVDFGRYVRPTAAVQIHELASRCLSDSRVYLSGISLLLFRQSIWAKDPATGPVGERLRENTPTGPIPMPVLIAQGDADPVVTPSAQAEYVGQRCAGGGRVDYRTYPHRDHLSLVAAGSPVISELLQWSRDRLDGRPARSTC